MKTISLKRALLISLIASFFVLAGCQEKGPAENAGESLDSAVDSTKDAMEDAGDNIEDAADDAEDSTKGTTN